MPAHDLYYWTNGVEHLSKNRSMWHTTWKANRKVAEFYGLTPDDFEHILNSFPVFARKRPEFFAYLKKRLAEWKTETEHPGNIIRLYPPADEIKDLPMAAETVRPYGNGEDSKS